MILFLTGLGAVTPAIPAGQTGGDNGRNGPLNQLPAGAVTVAFGGKQVAILFAGLAPTFVGLYQLNIQVPADMPGGAFPLMVSTKDGASQAGVVAAGEGAADLTGELGGGVKMYFVPINPGEFMMGCSPGDAPCYSDQSPVHRVQLTKTFQMGQYEVTQAQWQALMGRNPSYFKGTDLPVERVSWDDIQTFLQKVNARNDGYRYRLPTEAEWEYAGRAGTSDKYAGGVLDEVAWYNFNSSSRTHPVGQKKPNAWGLHDMLGNVAEWVQDWYGSYSSSLAVDPAGPSSGAHGTYRVLRGGGWAFDSWVTRVSSRHSEPTFYAGSGFFSYGFRCVRERYPLILSLRRKPGEERGRPVSKGLRPLAAKCS